MKAKPKSASKATPPNRPKTFMELVSESAKKSKGRKK